MQSCLIIHIGSVVWHRRYVRRIDSVWCSRAYFGEDVKSCIVLSEISYIFINGDLAYGAVLGWNCYIAAAPWLHETTNGCTPKTCHLFPTVSMLMVWKIVLVLDVWYRKWPTFRADLLRVSDDDRIQPHFLAHSAKLERASFALCDQNREPAK